MRHSVMVLVSRAVVGELCPVLWCVVVLWVFALVGSVAVSVGVGRVAGNVAPPVYVARLAVVPV